MKKNLVTIMAVSLLLTIPAAAGLFAAVEAALAEADARSISPTGRCCAWVWCGRRRRSGCCS
ncbi:MAG: hypothetical protein HC897_12975 [Thermoanaerobaculia bacterium]|nr:hypothetical protein [Thermoanaerobaculia bacterium]